MRAAESEQIDVLTSCCFLEAGQKLLLGSQSGSLRLCNDLDGDIAEDFPAHSSAIVKIGVLQSADELFSDHPQDDC